MSPSILSFMLPVVSMTKTRSARAFFESRPISIRTTFASLAIRMSDRGGVGTILVMPIPELSLSTRCCR